MYRFLFYNCDWDKLCGDSFAKASSDVGSQGTEEEGREVSDQPQAGQLPVLEELLQERQLLVVVRRIPDLADFLAEEAEVANQDRLVVGERIEGGLSVYKNSIMHHFIFKVRIDRLSSVEFHA